MKTDELAPTAPAGELATIPQDLIDHAGHGTENIGANDVKPPRLVLCQAGTPQRKKGDAKYIQGLEENEFFNDLSGVRYGEGPLEFVVVSQLGARAIEFNPMEDGGGVRDFNVPLDDPRAQFTTDKDGKRVKPLATLFYDYLVILLGDAPELVAFSLKGMQLKHAIKLNSLLKMPLAIGGRILNNPPAWARVFEIKAVAEKKDAYTYANVSVRQKGLAPDDIRAFAANLHAFYANKNVVIERDPGGADEAPASDNIPF